MNNNKMEYTDAVLSPQEIQLARERIRANRPLAEKRIWDIYPTLWKTCRCCFSKKIKNEAAK